MLAPASMVTLVACRMLPLPCQSPPTSTVPPPDAPLASILLVRVRVMSSPSKTILPPLLTKLLASKVPLFLTTPACSLFKATADKMICPSVAITACWLFTSVARVLRVVVMLARVWLPAKLRVMASPVAMATVPAWATTTPAFCTSGASSAM
ncbi:hypothetical protein MCEMAEM4_03360 [Burkholderiaceae bacterium]